jgi:hypothetical protein
MGSYSGNYRSVPPIAALPVIDRISFKEAVVSTINFTDTAVLDTGADVSNIPHALVNRHRLPVRDWEEVLWPDGSVRRCNVCLLEVTVPGLSAVIERFIDYGFGDVMLGRPLLNKWRVVLNPSRKRSGNYDIEIED